MYMLALPTFKLEEVGRACSGSRGVAKLPMDPCRPAHLRPASFGHSKWPVYSGGLHGP